MPSEATGPRRGEVWVDVGDVALLVISVDAYNGGRMQDVVCLGVYSDDLTIEDPSPYAAVVEVDGETWTVFYDDVSVVRKDELVDLRWSASDALMADAEDALREILTPAAARSNEPAKPRLYPAQSEIRFADLQIPGEQDKPVVVVSSTEYGRLAEYAFVVACRVSSNATTVRQYDVELRSQKGKVVCSHVQSVRLDRVKFRTTRGAAHVSAAEGDEIRAKVFALLGLE